MAMNSTAEEQIHDASVPREKRIRQRLQQCVADYVAHEHLLPPLTAEELAGHARCILEAQQVDATMFAYLALLLNNALWADVVARVPYERRLLLLPQCLSDAGVCQAEKDALGLLCKLCGACPIGVLQNEADRLGYVTLIAEGTTVVSKLLSSGKVDVVIGVGCLESLQRIFPLMNAHAIPGQGVPLLSKGCRRTSVDVADVLEMIRARQGSSDTYITELERVSDRVAGWFSPSSLGAMFSASGHDVQRIAIDWLMTGGKRWRPTLTAAVFEAAGGVPEMIRDVAVGVECFHKASLIHDDIEDSDELRYGEPTVHARHGIPAAINAGDYLIGEGYRLMAGASFESPVCVRLIRAAAQGHRELSLGQGAELAFCSQPRPVSESEVLKIYEQKTGAAFEVAVLAGAIAAGADAETCTLLSAFSRTVGIAYQIQDDIEDFRSMPGRTADLLSMRPTLFLAMACTSDHPDVRSALDAVWTSNAEGRNRLIEAIASAGLQSRVELLYAHYRHETERILSSVQHTGLKRLLRRIMMRMLHLPGDL